MHQPQEVDKFILSASGGKIKEVFKLSKLEKMAQYIKNTGIDSKTDSQYTIYLDEISALMKMGGRISNRPF